MAIRPPTQQLPILKSSAAQRNRRELVGAQMGFRARKSFKIAPGIRMTVTPKSVSAGVKGARISANSSDRVTHTVGIPGTGIYHTETLSSGHTRRRRQSAAAAKRGSNPKPGAAPQTFRFLRPQFQDSSHPSGKRNSIRPSWENPTSRFWPASVPTTRLPVLWLPFWKQAWLPFQLGIRSVGSSC
ncbi:DUF4236 domain-containing protein [Arthrobacter sp. Z1-15]